MKTKFYLLSLALAAILPVSCSQDTALNPEPQAETGCMSFNITLDRALTSRAGETDPLPTRCLLEVYEGATNKLVGKQQSTTSSSTSFSISVANLEKGKEYTFVFWADGGEDTYNTESLTAITPKKDNAIAFSGKTMTAVESGKTVSVTLSHVVAKLSLVHSADVNLTAGDQIMVQFTQQKYSFNALSSSYSKTEPQNVKLTRTVTADKTNGEIFSLYMLAPNDDMTSGGDKSMMVSDFKLGFQAKDATSSHSKEIPNVTFKANHRTVITGNIRDISFDTQKISVSLNQNWDEDIIPTPDEGGQPTEPEEPKQPDDPTPVTPVTPGNSNISLTSAGTLTESQIQSALANGNDLKIAGQMNDADFTTLRNYLVNNPSKTVNLDISETTVTSIPNRAFCITENVGFGDESEISKPITSLSSIILPNTMTSIGTEAFADCQHLQSVSIPASVTTIEDYAFFRTSITEVSAPGITTLGDGAFKECAELISVTLGKVQKIGSQAFFRSPKLTILDLSKCTSVPARPSQPFTTNLQLTIFVPADLLSGFKSSWSYVVSGVSTYTINWSAK